MLSKILSAGGLENSYNCSLFVSLRLLPTSGAGGSRRRGGESFPKTTTKKPGVSRLPMMPNEFGVCMVYGR